MKDKFEILNDVKIDIDEYKEIKFDNNDKIKNRMKSKIKSRKSSYKKLAVVASLAVVLGYGAIFNESVWANVETVWHSIQNILDFKYKEVKQYKYEINKSVEKKDIKVTYKNLMIDGGNLIIEMNIDDIKFNPFDDLTEKQQKDWYVDEWGNRETFITLGADSLEAYINGEKQIVLGGQANDDAKIEQDGSTTIITSIPINQIDKFNNNIYNIKLNTKKIYLSAQMNEGEKVRYGGVIEGDWSIDLDIKEDDLVKSTVEYKEYTIDKSINLNIDGINKDLQIDRLYISPIYTKIQMTTDIDGYEISDKYSIEIKLENENGEEYQIEYMTPNYDESKQSCKVEVGYKNIFKDNTKVKITPLVIDINSGEVIEQESIIVNLTENNN